MRLRIALLLAVCVIAAGSSVPGEAKTQSCQLNENNPAAGANLTPKTQDIPAFHGLKGHYALPKSRHPKSLVVMFHGHNNSSDSWVCHLLDAAAHGAVAVAMDYRGTGWGGPDGTVPASKDRGWFVKEGAADSLFAANYFLKRFPSIKQVIDFSISLGANAGGLALAADAKRPDGKTPMFDYWFDFEGVTSMVETYLEAQAVAVSGNATAVGAVQDIEKECHGSIAENPDCYRELTVLYRIQDIAASGVKGVFVGHDIDDGEVGTNQSPEMVAALRLVGIPTDLSYMVRRNDWQNPKTASTEGGTTLSGYVGNPVFSGLGQTYPQPFAGHGWEGSNTQLVMARALSQLWTLLDKGTVPADHVYVVDSELGTHQLA